MGTGRPRRGNRFRLQFEIADFRLQLVDLPICNLKSAIWIGQTAARLLSPILLLSEGPTMQLPDEAITYQYQSLLVPPIEEWTTAAELRARHFVPPNRLRELTPRLLQVRSQVAAERDLPQVPPELQPLDAAFIDLPQKTLDEHRRKGDESLLGRIQATGARLRDQVDRMVILGIGGSYLGARALFEALRSSYHNELPPDTRLWAPRIYFEGNNADNDSLQDLLDLLQTTCVDPELRPERWGVMVISKSGGTLETAAAYRILRREAAEYYGARSERLRQLFVAVTGTTGKLRDLCKAEGYADEAIFTIPDHVGGRYSVFTPAGLLPAAVMGLDVRALLLGAAAMTRRFLEEPFERNPVLQYAGVNYLVTEEVGKPIRVLSIWSRKLEALGLWYDQLVAESLGKQSRGPTPLTVVQTRDLHSRGQQHQEGPRDKMINNLVLKSPRTLPIPIGMADRNEDELNALSRKTLPNVLDAALRGANQAYAEVARPTADLILPTLSEHTMGQLMQMLMLATVVEGRLMGINPYGQPGVEAYKHNMLAILKTKEKPEGEPAGMPARPNGHSRDGQARETEEEVSAP
jgi:glucose-6-phosphate isomerase